LGKLVDAQESYRRIVNESLPANAPPAFLHAQESARAELAALTPRIAWITITVSGVEGATIKLDGQALSGAALGARRAVDPGPHEITAEARGVVVKRTTVNLGEGKAESVPLDLKASAESGAGPSGQDAGNPSAPGTPEPAPGGSSSLRKKLGFAGIGIGGA